VRSFNEVDTIQCRRCLRRVSEEGVGPDFLCSSCRTACDLLPVEQNVGRRFHTFLPPDLDGIPAIGDTNGVPFRDLLLHVRYYAPDYEFYVAEFDRRTGEAMGLVRRRQLREWTYVQLPDLERCLVNGDIVRRDLEFVPTRAGDL